MAEQSVRPDRLEQTEEFEAAGASHAVGSHAVGSHAAGSHGANSHPAIEQLLIHTEGSAPAREHERVSAAPALPPGLHIGMLRTIAARTAVVSVDGRQFQASLAKHVDGDFLRAALEEAEPVLLQNGSGGLLIMGVLKGRFPSRLLGDRVEITGESEVVMRSGKSALRLREDGVVDLIGARISASSRGLLRLVGRALRLN